MAKPIETEILRKIPVLSSFSDAELRQIIDAPDNTIEEYKAKEIIIRESEIGDCMYVILEGSADVSIRGEGGGVVGREISIATLRAGDFFGESSLDSDTTGRRKASVRAYQPCKVFKINKKHVHLAVKDTEIDSDDITEVPIKENEITKLMRKMRMFQALKAEELATVDTWAEVINVEPGDFVLKESQKGDCLYVVLNGSIEIFTFDDADKVVILAEHGRGDYFGEQALMPGSSGERNAYARANGATRLIKIPKAYFRLILNRDNKLTQELQQKGDVQKQELNKLHKK